MNILIIGGAGYIGSHCVRQLEILGHRAVVLDNFVTGHRQAIDPSIVLYEGDMGDEELVGEILRKEEIEVVMHFAAHAFVGESMVEPLKYYDNNLVKPIRLIKTMLTHKVTKFVFSSTCATYGIPKELPITEETPQHPINTYGQTKLDMENILRASSHAYGLSFASFRYFNAAGASKDGSIGEDVEPVVRLIPTAIAVAIGKRKELEIFGNDYPTKDGTCLRDYVHVDDISRAHIAIFNKLEQPGRGYFYNLGTGRPYSVREVIEATEKVTGVNIPTKESPRRSGDPPSLYADSSKAQKELDWEIEYRDIETIIKTSWRWHQSHPEGFKSKDQKV